MTHQLVFAARSDRGLIRSSNQDSVYAGNTLLVVADGMGGHAAGDMASRLVVAAFVPLDSRDAGGDLLRALAKATRDGNGAIAEVVHENPELDGMGTTVTALLFDGGRLGMAHVGDSRAYLYRDGVLHQLTHDDTFVQSLIDDGRITQEEAAHHPQRSLLLRALNGTDVDPSLTIREVTAGDRYLICSDGLPGVVSAEAIAEALANPDPAATADALIQLALVGGGPDNITVIVADVMDTGVGSGPTEAAAQHDPDATGPIGTLSAVRMTAEMPRVPLPGIPEDVPARAQYVSDDDYGDDTADNPDGPGVSGPPARKSRRRRGAVILVTSLVVLGVAAVIGSYFWVQSQYFVGADGGQVVVYRGVDGSVLGIQLSTVQEGTCEPGLNGCSPLMVEDLVPAARDQVTAGITAGTLADARGVVTRLAGQLLPACPVAQTQPAQPTATSTSPGLPAPTTAGTGGTTTAVPVPPTSPGAAGTFGSIADSAASLLPGGPSSTLSGGTVLNGPLATGSVLTTGTATGTGTPLASRAP
ncbi:MAG: PP2C family serine/threonine-protein phosphatase, partial [Nakamurella sp.]